MATTINTPDEIINIIADTLAEADARWLAEIASQLLIGECEVDENDNIVWTFDDYEED